ncbi:MAG: T9SS type A sorting domain-containing protein, partial [Ignavibacteriae bacterium]|nr:T9SS type A sorting domain-containing protein [Ignavibacteriota bacterium]
VYFSSNNGSSWKEINTGLPNSSVRSLIVSGNDIFAGVDLSIYHSNDNGATWTESNSGFPNEIVNCFEISGSNIFAGTNNSVYRSSDNGITWTNVNSGLTKNDVWALCTVGTNIFAGTNDGVFMTINNGENWSSTEYNGIDAWALTTSQNYLFAGGGLSRVYKRQLSDLITSVEMNTLTLPLNFKLEQNYPNPFNPTTNISFSIAKISDTSLKIYNLLGENITTLVDKEMTPGNYSVAWKASDLQSGIYFYKLNSGNYSETKKMLLLK